MSSEHMFFKGLKFTQHIEKTFVKINLSDEVPSEQK